MINEATLLPLLAVSVLVSAFLGYLWVTRRRSGTASLRPPASTPALNKVELIKRYREQYGVSLAEATAAIEAQLAERKEN